jgi:hypothetical protein
VGEAMKITICKPSKRGKPKQFIKARVKVSYKELYDEARKAEKADKK